jgi:hypothetical protein
MFGIQAVKRFFDSGPTIAFILARLYAWYVTPHKLGI